jgi:hypothetical protein
MVKDRVGNVLAKGQKILVALPESQIFGFIAEVKDSSIVLGTRRGGEQTPGMVLVSCVLALPVDPESGQVAQCVRVVDPDKHDDEAKGSEILN